MTDKPRITEIVVTATLEDGTVIGADRTQPHLPTALVDVAALSTAHELAARHGIDLWADSEPDGYWGSQPPGRVRAALVAALTEQNAIEDLLAEALGYQRSDGGPDDPNGGGFVIGDHTAYTLAVEAASALKGLGYRRQCTGAVHDRSGSAPERCADTAGHDGECAP